MHTCPLPPRADVESERGFIQVIRVSFRLLVVGPKDMEQKSTRTTGSAPHRMRTAAFALVLAHGFAAAGGYEGWQFGMTQAQVKAVGDPSRYYSFKNGDLGAGQVPFETGEALISFYFTNDRMERVMLIAYLGDDAGLARRAWSDAYAHLARVCGDVESPAAGDGAIKPEAALAAYDRAVPALAPGKRHQMACLRMPADARVWASVTRGEGNLVMVSVDYGKP